MGNDLKYYVGFSHFLGIGPHKLNGLISYFGSIENAYNAKISDLRVQIGTVTAEKFAIFRKNFIADSVIDSLCKKNIHILPVGHQDYPYQLAQINDPPICLYLKGSLKNLNTNYEKCIAVVGTRSPTEYGISTTISIAKTLVKSGLVIVSGMALGIDTLAHQQAVNGNMPTIAVLGCGVEIVYPASNRRLYSQILENDGCIVSEFPPNQVVMKGLFIARNRVISGLSKGIVVIEGTKDSGSLITARYAANQGKNVYAVPGPINSTLSQAPNILLKQGAKMVTTIQDILEDYQTQKQTDLNLPALTQIQNEIVNILIREPREIDGIASNLDITDIQIIGREITSLELMGIIQKNRLGKYEIIQ